LHSYNIKIERTIRDNIVLNAPYVDDRAVLRAAQLSGLLDFIQHHPEGFDMQIEEGGKNLSGGQKQMVAISRAFLHNPPVLLLDEPTGAMDDKSSTIFKNNLTKQIGNKTLLLVTHRGSMLNLVNRIIILDYGQIIADGPKDSIQSLN